MNESKKEIKGFTFLRFISALFIFLFHIQIRYPFDVSIGIQNILKNGAVGMTFFFMLSGVVLSFKYKEKTIDSLGNFYLNRLVRIYPAYAFMMILSLPLLFDIFVSSDHKFISLMFIVFDLFLLQSWFPPSFDFWHNGGSWSLSVEFFFYLIFPLARFLISRLKKPSEIVIFILVIYFLSVAPGVIYNNYPLKDIFSATYASPVYRMFEFLFGIAIGLNIEKLRIKNIYASVGFFICVIFFVSYFYVFGEHEYGYIGHNFFVVPITGMLIIFLFNIKVGLVANVVAFPLFNYLGKISYSFYLMQLPVIFYSQLPEIHQHLVNMSPWQVLLLLGVVIMIVSAFSYHYIETYASYRLKIILLRFLSRHTDNKHDRDFVSIK